MLKLMLPPGQRSVVPVKVEPELHNGRLQSAGVYIEGSVEGVDVWYTVDTGATRTILSERVYKRIPEEKRPSLCKGNGLPLSRAGGHPLIDMEVQRWN